MNVVSTSICDTKTIQGALVSSFCNLCIHMSQSEQPCRVSWVLSEASSWAEYEHKWCFHSALLPAIWILPQAFISMAAAFSLIPGLCVCISLSLLLSDLNAPPNYSWILSSTFLFPSWISTSYLLLHSVPPWLTLDPCLFAFYFFSLPLWFFFFFLNLPLFSFSVVSQPCISPLLYDDHPLQLPYPSSPLPYLLIECQLLHFSPLLNLSF